MSMRRVFGLLMLAATFNIFWGTPTLAHGVHVDGDADDADHQHEEEVDASFTGGLNDYLKRTGIWQRQRGFLAETAQRIATLREWDTDFDRFALRVITEVTAIPPWEGENRTERLLDLLSERYDLDSNQRESVSDIITRISTEWQKDHDDSLTACTLDAMEVRATGQLITPELAMLWTQQAGPALEDARERFTLATRRYMSQLRPEQREKVLADIRIANQRQDTLISTSEQWGIGHWTEALWGLDQDPIQQQAHARLERDIAQQAPETNSQPSEAARIVAVEAKPASSPAAELPAKQATSKSQDLDDWARYVHAFIKRYSLTEDQSQSAWRIHARVNELRQNSDRRFEHRIAELEKRDAKQSPRGERLLRSTRGQQQNITQGLFERLQTQLEKLPTRQQREAVESVQAQR